MAHFDACGHGWVDVLNNREHPRHRCSGMFMHSGRHVCNVKYRDSLGNMVSCGAIKAK